jgi:NodT family efflux transporter outer membrane factor (OMF) lipoprotein
MVGPDYQTPEIGMPDRFEEGREADAITDEELCGWWRQFDDPLLDCFIEDAVRGNYNYLIALEQVISARAQYQIQSSYLWPQINVDAAAIRERFSQNIFSGGANREAFATGQGATDIGAVNFPAVQNFFQIGFDAVWELDIWGKFRRAKQAAFDTWEMTQFLADNILISVIGEVARDYVMIRSLQAQIDLWRKIVTADERELELTKVLFVAGLANEIAVQTEQSALDTDRAQLPPLETALKQLIYAFAVLLGKQPEELTHAFDDMQPMPIFVGKVPAGLPSELLRRRPDVRASERNLAAATAQIGVAVAGLFPAVSLTGNGAGFESNQFSTLTNRRSKYWSIGPSLLWDLIDFGKVRGQIDMANAQQRQALLSYENTVITALQDVEGALVAYFEEQDRNSDLSEKVAADSRSLELTADLSQAGLASEIQELASLKTALRSQTLLIQSQAAIASDLISIYKALGGNWECTSTP